MYGCVNCLLRHLLYVVAMNCEICRRDNSGLAWYDPELRPRMSVIHHACSTRCLNIIIDTKGKFVHTTQSEKDAIEVGGQSGGAYLDSIGKFSLDQLSKAEYDEFCSRVFFGACEKLQDIAALETEVPY